MLYLIIHIWLEVMALVVSIYLFHAFQTEDGWLLVVGVCHQCESETFVVHFV